MKVFGFWLLMATLIGVLGTCLCMLPKDPGLLLTSIIIIVGGVNILRWYYESLLVIHINEFRIRKVTEFEDTLERKTEFQVQKKQKLLISNSFDWNTIVTKEKQEDAKKVLENLKEGKRFCGFQAEVITPEFK